MKRFLHPSFVIVTVAALLAVAGVGQAAGPKTFSKSAIMTQPANVGSINRQLAVQKPNPAGPVSLNPQPLPPRYAQTYRPSDQMVRPAHWGNPIGVGTTQRPPIYVK